ncbi:MAG: hypothetical protein JXJ04_03345 [Spirochaetales bacterium]|nr:hypothetical protein [Spirochaetales bacterium]
MHINLDINKTLKDCVETSRTDLLVWKDLDHLKSYYAEAIDGGTIDKIAAEIRKEKTTFVDRDYDNGENLGTHLNERCFCNLVEMKLIGQSNEALKQFLEKPLYDGAADLSMETL